MPEKKKTYDLDGWESTPGFVLCRPVKREELQKSESKMMLPDNVGKVSDSVGVGEVIALGGPTIKQAQEFMDYIVASKKQTGVQMGPIPLWERAKPGDLIAFMPYTDTVIEIKLVKYILVPYDKIRAVRRSN